MATNTIVAALHRAAVKDVNTKLQAEASRHGDLVRVNEIDVYRHLPQKVKAAYTWALANTAAEWFAKVDDDFVVHVGSLEDYILRSQRDALPFTVIGSIVADAEVPRTGRWAEDPVAFNKSRYPKFPMGSYGHVVSRNVAAYVSTNAQTLVNYQGEDVSLGIWLDESPHSKDVVWRTSKHFDNSGNCYTTDQWIIGHRISSARMRSCFRRTTWGADTTAQAMRVNTGVPAPKTNAAMAVKATRILTRKLGREPTREEVATKVKALREKEVAAAKAPVQFETDTSDCASVAHALAPAGNSEGNTCATRIAWVKENHGRLGGSAESLSTKTQLQAEAFVGNEHPFPCSPCTSLGTKATHNFTSVLSSATENTRRPGPEPTHEGMAKQGKAFLPARGAVAWRQNIDFVIPWSGPSASTSSRERDNGEMVYLLRSIAINAPWVHHVWLMVNGKVEPPSNIIPPGFNSRVTVIDRCSYMPEGTCPTMNSHAVELFAHNIPDLTEHFVIIEDDIFLGRPVTPEHLFSGDGGRPYVWRTAPTWGYFAGSTNGHRVYENPSVVGTMKTPLSVAPSLHYWYPFSRAFASR